MIIIIIIPLKLNLAWRYSKYSITLQPISRNAFIHWVVIGMVERRNQNVIEKNKRKENDNPGLSGGVAFSVKIDIVTCQDFGVCIDTKLKLKYLFKQKQVYCQMSTLSSKYDVTVEILFIWIGSMCKYRTALVEIRKINFGHQTSENGFPSCDFQWNESMPPIDLLG